MNLNDINSGLNTINTALPILMAAYQAYKAVWGAANPGMTEADYLTQLQQAAQANVDLAAAVLTPLGYVKQADGSWQAPAA